MYKGKPDLGYFLAEEAIKNKYKMQQSWDDFSHLLQIYDKENVPEHLRDLYLRQQRIKINAVIAEVVIENLPDIQRQFMRYKYNEGKSLVWISQRLNIAKQWLNTWNRNILENIESLLFYTISEQDVFYRNKVLNIIQLIDWRIETITMWNMTGPDAVNIVWYGNLGEKRCRYRQLLQLMDRCLSCGVEDLYSYIVAMKLRYPNDNISELANRCYVTPSCVSKKLKNYMMATRKYLK